MDVDEGSAKFYKQVQWHVQAAKGQARQHFRAVSPGPLQNTLKEVM